VAEPAAGSLKRLPAPRRPFDIGLALLRIRKAVRPLPKAAMFALAEDGHRSLYRQVVACILSVRTFDEVSLVAARRLFAAAPEPADLARLAPTAIDRLIGSVTFHRTKADSIREVARAAAAQPGGELPCDASALLTLPGVGPKCAHLALGIACGEQRISVDIHVHRVTNRWGYVRAPTPERTMAELERRLPRRHWIELNSLLVPFGKHVCTGRLPHCSTCPVLDMCRRVGVTAHR
jgi:endonuclease-3